MQSNWQAMQSFWEGFDYQLLVCFFRQTINAFIGMRFARTGPITIPDPKLSSHQSVFLYCCPDRPIGIGI